MDLGNAQSKSISLPMGLWELVDYAGGVGNRTKYIRNAVEERLRADGHLAEASQVELIVLIREANAQGVSDDDIRSVIAQKIAEANETEGSAA